MDVGAVAWGIRTEWLRPQRRWLVEGEVSPLPDGSLQWVERWGRVVDPVEPAGDGCWRSMISPDRLYYTDERRALLLAIA